MKKFLLVALLAGLTNVAYGEAAVAPTLNMTGAVALLDEESLDVTRQQSFTDEYREIQIVEEKPVARTTTSFTGVEYERFNNQKGDNAYDVSYILLDGYTRITDNWGVIHVAKRRQTFVDGDRVNDANIIEVFPRYDRNINENWDFGFEFGVEAVVNSEWGDEDYFKYRPDVTYRNGDHILNTAFLGVNVSQTGKDFYEFEPTYLYSVNDLVTLGLQGFRRDGNDNYLEHQIRPFVQFSFDNSAFLELKLEIGRWEDQNGNGGSKQEFVKAIAYGEYPITEGFRAVGEVSHAQRDEQRATNDRGDTDTYFVKAGIKWTL